MKHQPSLLLLIGALIGIAVAGLPQNCGLRPLSWGDPWLVRITYLENPTSPKFWRTGVLISKRYVLTTAANESDLPTGEISVTLKPATYTRIHLRVTRKDFVLNPAANSDLVLLRLDKDYTFDVDLQPICLPTTESLRATWPDHLTAYLQYGDRAETPTISTISLRQCPRLSDAEGMACMGPAKCADVNGAPMYAAAAAAASHNGQRRIVLHGFEARAGSCLADAHIVTKIAPAMDWIVETVGGQKLRTDSSCGVPKNHLNELIVNGQNAIASDWPWHAVIKHQTDRNTREYACGGALIHELFIITAEHCTRSSANAARLSHRLISVEFGVQKLNVWTAAYQQHAVIKIHTVSKAKSGLFKDLRNDIALLELKTEAIVNDYVLPICLPARDVSWLENGTVTGFGITEEDQVSTQLKLATMPVLEDFRCARSELGMTDLDEGLFCAGYTNGTTVCNGDSGGGFVLLRDGVWQLGAGFVFPHGVALEPMPAGRVRRVHQGAQIFAVDTKCYQNGLMV